MNTFLINYIPIKKKFLKIELALPCAKRTHLATDGYSKKKKECMLLHLEKALRI